MASVLRLVAAIAAASSASPAAASASKATAAAAPTAGRAADGRAGAASQKPVDPADWFACRPGSGPCNPRPTWKPTYKMSESTSMQVCNFSGYQDPASISKWGLVDFDWENARGDNVADGWEKVAPMDCGERMTKQVDMMLEAYPNSTSKYMVYRNYVRRISLIRYHSNHTENEWPLLRSVASCARAACRVCLPMCSQVKALPVRKSIAFVWRYFLVKLGRLSRHRLRTKMMEAHISKTRRHFTQWLTVVREKLTDPAYSTWFLNFSQAVQANRSLSHVPVCDDSYTPPLCTHLYHDQLLTPKPKDCGGAENAFFGAILHCKKRSIY